MNQQGRTGAFLGPIPVRSPACTSKMASWAWLRRGLESAPRTASTPANACSGTIKRYNRAQIAPTHHIHCRFESIITQVCPQRALVAGRQPPARQCVHSASPVP